MNKIIIIIFVLLTPVLLISCGGGIEPEPEYNEEAGFGGTVFFSGEWPDSVTRTHIVVFKNPLTSIEDFNILNLAYVSMEIPYGVSEYSYSTLDSSLFPIGEKLSSGIYSFIAVAQQKTMELSLNRNDWYVVGLYYNPGDNINPGILDIPTGRFISDIDIMCDFDNPPIQPPGGDIRVF